MCDECYDGCWACALPKDERIALQVRQAQKLDAHMKILKLWVSNDPNDHHAREHTDEELLEGGHELMCDVFE